MPIYPYSFQLPPLNVQDIPNDGAVGEFLGISAGGVLDWLPVSASGSGDMLKSENLSGLADYPTARTNLGLGTGNSPQFTGLQFSTDTFLTRGGAANLQLGAADAAAPVAQTLSVQSVVSGTTNTAGQAFTIDGSQGTGLGAGGSIIFRTAPSGSAGSTVNALGTHMILGSDGVTTLRANGVPQLRMISSFGSGSVFNGLTLESDTSTLAGFLVNRSTGEIKIGGLSSAGYFPTFYSNNAERMRITTTGNVGIGTTAPNSVLHVQGSCRINPYTSSVNSGVVIDDTGGGGSPALRGFSSGTTERFRFVTGSDTGTNFIIGNVGIGTTAPGAKLDILTSASDDGIKITNSSASSSRLSLYNNSGHLAYFCSFGSGVGIGLTNSAAFGGQNSIVIGSDATVGSGGTNSIQFRAGGYNADQERMRITSAGNVGIGTTAPSSKLHVEGGTSPTVLIRNTATTGYSQLTFGNTVVTGTGLWLNGSIQTGYGGANSLNVYSSDGPIAFHTATATNAFSIAQTGATTFSQGATFNTDIYGQRDVYCGNNRYFRFANATALSSNAVGVMLLSDLTSVNLDPRMAFGGTTASFPAIKRSTTSLQARLADDSAFTNIQGKLTTDTAFTSGAITDTGYIVLYDSTGTAYKVACTPV